MPVTHAVDEVHKVFAYRFVGSVSVAEVERAVAEVGAAVTRPGRFCSLQFFESTTDLSDLSVNDLRDIKAHMKAVYGRAGLKLGISAVVVDASYDASLIMPLWEALCDEDPELEIEHRFFHDVEQACAWLELPAETGRALLARTAPDAE